MRLYRLRTLQPEIWAGLNRLCVANSITLFVNCGSLAPVIWTELVSATPSGRTTNSTATLSAGIIPGTGSVRGVPMMWANGKASSDTYFETLSETPAQRNDSSGEIVTGLGPEAHAPAKSTTPTTRNLFKGSPLPRRYHQGLSSCGLFSAIFPRSLLGSLRAPPRVFRRVPIENAHRVPLLH